MFEAIIVVLIIYLMNMWSSVGKVEALNGKLDVEQRKRLKRLAPTSMAKYAFYQKYKADIDKKRIPYVLLEDDTETEPETVYDDQELCQAFEVRDEEYGLNNKSGSSYEEADDGWHSIRECMDLKHEERCETYDMTTRDRDVNVASDDSSFDVSDRSETEDKFECENLDEDDDAGCFTGVKDVVCGVIWSEILNRPRCLGGGSVKGPRR